MDGSQHKKIRVSDMGRESHITGTALAKLLRSLADADIPESFSRSTQQREREAEAFQMTTYGPLLQKLVLQGVNKRGQPCDV
eukprot:5361002-Pyramimonas_sp.AAC.1